MATPFAEAVDRVRRPEYTGENRCVPCTAVNVLIALVLAAVVAAAVFRLGPTVAGSVGVVILVGSLAMIYLRGYLVPGTPWVTKTYFPDWVLRRFDKESPRRSESPVEDVDLEPFLKDAGVVTECPRTDDLCLTDAFQVAWRDQIEALRTDDTSREDLAAILEVDPAQLSVEDYGDAFVARLDGRRAGQWESQAAFLADVAASNVLHTFHDGWTNLAVQPRSQVLNGLRIFLDRCPSCDGPVAMEEEVVESCCRSFNVVAVTCRDCDSRLFEAEQPG